MGHGLSDKGGRDWGATIRDSNGALVLSERSEVKEIGTHIVTTWTIGGFSNYDLVGFDPYSTRDNIDYANRRAREANCTFETCRLISLHANWAATPNSSGAVAYYNAAVPGGKEYAQRVAKAANPNNWRAVPDTANRFGRLGMVRDVENVNSVLLEVGYLTNPDDLKNIQDYQEIGQRIATAVVTQ